MNACIVYFSRTGNTKRLAEALADMIKAPIYSITNIQPSSLDPFDLIILGTPVEGASPAKETVAFIESMPQSKGKKTILFCTNRLFGAGRTLNAMQKMLDSKGYETLLKVSKKGMKPEKEADFTEVLQEVKKTLDKQ